MNKFIKSALAVLSATMVSNFSFAQDQKAKPKDDKAQEIIIRNKAGNTKKMTIVVDGDNVTINGKPVDEFKTADVTILKRRIPFPPAAPGAPDASFARSFVRKNRDFAKAMNNFHLALETNRAFLGILTEKAEDGVKIKEVTKESGAEKAGLQTGDIIIKVDTTNVNTPQQLVAAIGRHKPADKVDITYKRNGKENKTSAVLGENEHNFSFNFDDKDFNFEMPELPEAPEGVMPPMDKLEMFMNRKPKIGLQIQDVEEGKGVTVKDVDNNSPASKAGLKEGDVITQLNGKEVAGVDELRNAIREAKEGETVKMSYKRDGKTQNAEIKIPKKLKLADL